ncbi:HTH_Tnp_Tc3_2 domain-containing protein [Trichonephila clavipes]|nr:HTH_Tnp_Tc3_2 domain-containing protein [Trichonephila clavipes]
MPRRKIQAHYEQLPEFERGRTIGSKEEGWAIWRIGRHMGRTYAAIRRCWQEWAGNGIFQRRDCSDSPKATADREERLIVRSSHTWSDSSLSTIRRATRTRVFTMTIRRRLIDRHLLSYRSLRHLPLTSVHFRARLQWCLGRSGWNHAD